MVRCAVCTLGLTNGNDLGRPPNVRIKRATYAALDSAGANSTTYSLWKRTHTLVFFVTDKNYYCYFIARDNGRIHYARSLTSCLM